jgi:Zn-dependent protease
MGEGLTLFRIRGIPVRVQASWLFVYGLISWSLSVGYFPRVLPDVPVLTHWATGFLAALLLFVSVFLHELSHTLVARHHGVGVSAITLHIFGGVSELQDEPPSPATEFWIAIVGPATSFVLAAVAAVAASLVPGGSVPAAVLGYLIVVNALVGIFNLVPGFPLDGGRVLRAALWRMKGDLRRATEIASRVGTSVAVLLMALGAVRAFTGDFLGGVWFVLIGLFLRQASTGSYRQLVVRRMLEPVRVRDVMTREVITLDPGMPLTRAVDDFFWRHHVSSFPVATDGRLLGILSLRRFAELPRERWAATTVGDVMTPLGPALTAAPGDDLWTTFQKLSSNGLGRIAVLDGTRLVGYLSTKDVMHVLAVVSTGRPPAQSA